MEGKAEAIVGASIPPNQYAAPIAKKVLAEGNKAYPGDELTAKLSAVIAKFEEEYAD